LMAAGMWRLRPSDVVVEDGEGSLRYQAVWARGKCCSLTATRKPLPMADTGRSHGWRAHRIIRVTEPKCLAAPLRERGSRTSAPNRGSAPQRP
jgi:hypothetical protein